MSIQERLNHWDARLNEFAVGQSLLTYPSDLPDESKRECLTGWSLANATQNAVADETAADCCHSGLWLLHQFLDESHRISQSVDTAEGSWWHAIMHRLEGDFGNSQYWYCRSGDHPVRQRIESMVQRCDLANHWDPIEFVDRCRDSAGLDANLNQIARIEWLELFEHCWSLATGHAS